MKFCTVFMLQMNVRLQWVKRVMKVNTSNTEPIKTHRTFLPTLNMTIFQEVSDQVRYCY